LYGFIIMSEITPGRVHAGQALYSKFFLNFYDIIALTWNLRFAWRCPAHHMIHLYDDHVSGNHLDIGVGSGYFLDRCTFPVENPRLALMDLNPNCLKAAGKKLERYNPEKYLGNILEPTNNDGDGFDSVGLINIFHCLPGSMKTKAIVFDNVKHVMNPGAVVFGSTILGKGVEQNILARYLNWFNNKKGYMNNSEDDPETLAQELARFFSKSEVKVIGTVALFSARK